MIDLKGVITLVLALVVILIVAAAGIYAASISGFVIFSPQAGGTDNAEGNPSGLIVGTPTQNQPGGGQTSASGPAGTPPTNNSANTQQNQTTNRTTTTTGSTGGGGGGGGTPSCSPSPCNTAWSECAPNGTQTRLCVDTCTSSSSIETQSCQYMPPQEPGNCNGVCLIPSALSISKSQNSTFNIYVYINTTESVYAAALDLGYDNGKVNVTGVTEGDFLKKDNATTFTTQPINDYVNGVLRNYGDTRFNTQSGVSGSGVLMNVVFSADATGTASLSLGNVTIVGPDLQALNIPVSGSSVINIAA